jgi:acyl carrier protein
MNTQQPRAINAASLRSELTAIIANVLDREAHEIPYEADLVEELDVDSVMILEIVVTLERVYGCQLAQKDMASMRSIKGASELLLARFAPGVKG